MSLSYENTMGMLLGRTDAEDYRMHAQFLVTNKDTLMRNIYQLKKEPTDLFLIILNGFSF